ncbi:uncharacterized protein LOC131637902 [Vicia villosa]|uniref:uncharacterized protein LOC131637902 n=1 Tax=Vicia villosa TaxID=3911 RepID=UPI00273A7930|nr:uncharacterized protein LOC131637902 [Vicia villosa]
MDNSTCVLGNGSSISLWSDRWCGSPLFLHSDAPVLFEEHSVDRLLINGSWDFSRSATYIPASLQVRICSCTIPIVSRPDKRCWDNSPNGELSLKLAYDFKRSRGIPQDRWKMIWNNYIPPSISFMVWRLMHHKMPTDDLWLRRGFSFPSRCSLCGCMDESEQHLFFNCRFALMLWSWLKSMLNLSFSILGWEDIWRILDKDGAVQCKVINLAAVFSLLHTIWFARNKARFNDLKLPISSCVSSIKSSVFLAGNAVSHGSHLNMQDFALIKSFKVTIRPPRAPNIKEVLW